MVTLSALGAALFAGCGGQVSLSGSPGGSGRGGLGGSGGIVGEAGAGGVGGAGAAQGGASGTAAGGGAAGGASGGSAGSSGVDAGGSAGTGSSVPGGVPGTSCQGSGIGLEDCGPASESCCTRPLVTGGSFYRDYDSYYYTDKTHPATVSSFRLDKYEITAGRFRNFIAAWDAGWRPAQGAGKHAHLNGGKGLANSAPAGGYERGWRKEWDSELPASPAAWYDHFGNGYNCGGWTPDDSYDGRHPVECLDWYDAYAFCIWDGGFLPSEAEWNYAAAGGDQQRVYPWSSPPTSSEIDCTRAVYTLAIGAPCGATPPAAPEAKLVGSDSPAGDGRWGQADLAGNVGELVLDGYAPLNDNCVDCAYGVPDDTSPSALARGGGYRSFAAGLVVSFRPPGGVDPHQIRSGARCAYSP